jgi:hypothetical protein
VLPPSSERHRDFFNRRLETKGRIGEAIGGEVWPDFQATEVLFFLICESAVSFCLFSSVPKFSNFPILTFPNRHFFPFQNVTKKTYKVQKKTLQE